MKSNNVDFHGTLKGLLFSFLELGPKISLTFLISKDYLSRSVSCSAIRTFTVW